MSKVVALCLLFVLLGELPMMAQSSMLQTGTVYNEAALGEMENRWQWFVIPEWLAGKWHRTNQKSKFLGLFSVDMKADRNRVFGFQTDELGRIWHLVRVPYKAKVMRSYGFDVFVVRDEEMTAATEDSVTIKTTWSRYIVENGIVQSVKNGFQNDRIQRQNTTPQTTKTTSTGTEVAARWIDTKVQEYAPIEFYKGVYLRKSLTRLRESLHH